MIEKENIYQSRNPDQMFDLYEPTSGTMELYIDGVGQLMLGTTVSKLSFYSVGGFHNENGEDIEQREVKLRVTMPTRKLLESCIKILASFQETASTLEANLEEEKQQLSQFLTSLPTIPNQPQE